MGGPGGPKAPGEGSEPGMLKRCGDIRQLPSMCISGGYARGGLSCGHLVCTLSSALGSEEVIKGVQLGGIQAAQAQVVSGALAATDFRRAT